MDTLTHALLGATVARASAPAHGTAQELGIKQRVTIGALAAAFPDIDYITILIDPLAFIAEWHRSITHSLLMLPLWAVLLGLVFARLFGAPHRQREIMLICGLSLASHILTDMITIWGTQIFAPVSDYAPAWGITFIIDPWFSAIIALSLFIALRMNSRHAARVGIILLSVFVGLQTSLKFQAQALGRDFAAQQDWTYAEVQALPQPLSPFNWMVVVTNATQHHMALVNLLREETHSAIDDVELPFLRLLRHYRPPAQLNWVSFPHIDAKAQAVRAWTQPQFAQFRKFATLPYLIQHETGTDESCSWFADLRFYLPELDMPFRYGICESHTAGRWQVYRLRGAGADRTSGSQPYN